MKPVDCEDRSSKDAWRCCLASVLEFERDEVPNFTQIGGITPSTNWWTLSRKWVAEHSELSLYWKELNSWPRPGTEPRLLGLNPSLEYKVEPYAILSGYVGGRPRAATPSVAMRSVVVALPSFMVVHNPSAYKRNPDFIDHIVLFAQELP